VLLHAHRASLEPPDLLPERSTTAGTSPPLVTSFRHRKHCSTRRRHQLRRPRSREIGDASLVGAMAATRRSPLLERGSQAPWHRAEAISAGGWCSVSRHGRSDGRRLRLGGPLFGPLKVLLHREVLLTGEKSHAPATRNRHAADTTPTRRGRSARKPPVRRLLANLNARSVADRVPVAPALKVIATSVLCCLPPARHVRSSAFVCCRGRKTGHNVAQALEQCPHDCGRGLGPETCNPLTAIRQQLHDQT
jgi:hypothetical protein